jgi:hypothetical protein
MMLASIMKTECTGISNIPVVIPIKDCGVIVLHIQISFSMTNTLIVLTPTQSIALHGIFNPKKTLRWIDIVNNKHITIRSLIKTNITQSQLKLLQPDIYEWINVKHASFNDVCLLTEFPLHPITHLNGDLTTLIEYKYPASLLNTLKIDYFLLRALHMDSKWMKVLNFEVYDWKLLGFTEDDVRLMSNQDVEYVFDMDKTTMMLKMASFSHFDVKI